MSLSKILQNVSKENKQVIITGDFLSYTKNERINDFVEIIYENVCQPCIMQPTRVLVENQNPSLNTIENPVGGNLIDRISDYFPNFIIIENTNQKGRKDADIYKRNTKNYNQIVFQNQLIEHFSTVYNPNLTVNELSNGIIDTFIQTLDKNAPMQKMTNKEIKNIQRPWITKCILKAIRIKTRWLKKFRRNKK